MRLVSYVLLALIALFAGAGAFLYVALPTDFIRDELVALVKSHTGRTLTVAGPVSISFYPDIAVDLNDVTLSPPPGMAGEPLLTMRALALKMSLWPLLRHTIRIERFVLDQPVIVLHTDGDGHRSWDFARAPAPGEPAAMPPLRGTVVDPGAQDPGAKPDASGPAASQTRLDALAGLELGDIRINNGTIRFVDDRTGLKQDLTDVTLQLQLDSLAGPATAEGSVTWLGEALPLQARVEPFGSLLTEAPAAIAATVSGRLAKASIKGQLALLDATPLTGQLDLKTDSLRDLLHWLGRPLPAGSGFGKTTLSAKIELSAARVQAEDVLAELDGASAKGSFAADLGQPKPTLHAKLALDRLDLNTYLGAGTPAPSAAGDAKDPSPPGTADATANDPGASWSNVPIDLSALRLADADIALTLGGLSYRNIKVGRGTANSTLKDGVLRTRFVELLLYDGKGTGSLVVDAHAATTKMEASFSLHAIQIQPFLTDATGFKRIAGRGDVSFGFTGSGRSQKDMVASLMGQGRIELADGAIVGTDFPRIMRALQKGNISGWQDEPTAKTDFNSLTATCTVTNGIVANDDLALAGPLLRLTGAGKASIPALTLDYTARPTVVASLEGQGASDAGGGATGIAIPLHITGPWAKPNVALDLAALAKDPKAVLDTVKKALSQVKGSGQVQDAIGKLAGSKEGKALGDLLGGLLGQGGGQPETTPAPQ